MVVVDFNGVLSCTYARVLYDRGSGGGKGCGNKAKHSPPPRLKGYCGLLELIDKLSIDKSCIRGHDKSRAQSVTFSKLLLVVTTMVVFCTGGAEAASRPSRASPRRPAGQTTSRIFLPAAESSGYCNPDI